MMQKLLFGLAALIVVVQGLNLEEQLDLPESLRIALEFERIKSAFTCECEVRNSCTCCGKIAVKQLGMDEKSCIELTYDGSKTALTITFSMNDKVLLSRTVSANNPPAICVGHPAAQVIADICFNFYDLQVSLDKFKVCLDIQPRVFLRKVTNIEVGCLSFEQNEEE
ncbi:DUF4773 domain-containing protein [Trichonephila clavipes]|nr:DUF4773 domain-containing protein [Trichonephila clavipes]